MLIELPNVPTIGVGELTIQNLKSTLSTIGIDEADFILRCNASFKMGVHFVDWSRASGSASSRSFSPLNNPPACGGDSPVHHFRKFGPHRLGASFAESILPNAAMIAAGKGPRPLQYGSYTLDINYAYHLDAALFATFMRDFAVARGIEHLGDNLVMCC